MCNTNMKMIMDRNTIIINNTKMKVNVKISMCINSTMNMIINMITTVNVNMDSEMKINMTIGGNKILIQLQIPQGMTKCMHEHISSGVNISKYKVNMFECDNCDCTPGNTQRNVSTTKVVKL